MKSLIRINTSSETPIYQQIVEGIEQAIISGTLGAGEMLPSVRELAVQLQLNPNTVAKAYKSLQAMNLVEAVRGKGLKVRPMSEKKTENRKLDIIQQKISDLLKLAESLNISKEELIQSIKKEKK
ncbi:MAG: GntR family transcriptional regulator [Bdellovibrionales bacterium]|nr:GntR family transcriptional regulator [Bdellovibrionales bacterium]